MTDKQAINAIVDKIVVLHRNNLKTLARLKALETIVAMNVPPAERELWYKQLDEQNNRCLQDLLEEFEKQSPAWAALLDDRGADELTGLDE
jgi:hypothetical protein